MGLFLYYYKKNSKILGHQNVFWKIFICCRQSIQRPQFMKFGVSVIPIFSVCGLSKALENY